MIIYLSIYLCKERKKEGESYCYGVGSDEARHAVGDIDGVAGASPGNLHVFNVELRGGPLAGEVVHLPPYAALHLSFLSCPHHTTRERESEPAKQSNPIESKREQGGRRREGGDWDFYLFSIATWELGVWPALSLPLFIGYYMQRSSTPIDLRLLLFFLEQNLGIVFVNNTSNNNYSIQSHPNEYSTYVRTYMIHTSRVDIVCIKYFASLVSCVAFV